MEKQTELEPINIEDYRVLILNKEGTWYKYRSEVGKMHQDCVFEFAKETNAKSSRMDDIVSDGNFLFLIVNKDMLALKAPSEMTDEQSMQLDFFSLSLKDVSYLEIEKRLDSSKTVSFLYDNYITEQFSNDFLQSYYQKGKNR